MIIRKPFAFLVEKFKLLHFIILIPCIYLAYKLWNLMNFFQDFVASGYATKEVNVVNNYYSFLMIISLIVVIVFFISITLLFRKKNKNDKAYVLLTLFYLMLLAYTIMLPSLLNNAQLSTLDSSTSLIVRGATNIFFWVQIISLIIILLLMFGFDFSTGEFLEIRDEINLDEEDSEEVEININREDYKIKRGFRRYFREIKYYIIENKNIFKVIFAILGFVLVVLIIKFIISLNTSVKVDQNFRYSNFQITFNDSYLSTLDYSGNKIMDGKVYLAVKVKVKNITNDLVTLNTSDFCLYLNDECYYPTLDRSGKFLDIAKPYYAEAIGKGVENEYVLVYELDEGLAKSTYKIRILDSLVKKNDDIIPKYKEINLTPSYSDTVTEVGSYSIDNEIEFKNSTLLDSKLNIKDYLLTNNYKYSYDFCYNDNCILSYNSVNPTSGKYLLVIDDELYLDENASYTKYKLGTNNFFNDFVKVEYYINDNKYETSVVDKTPQKSDKTTLEVNSNVTLADKINLIITIRDKRYTINLKES